MRVVSYYRYSTDNKSQVDNSEARQKDSVEQVVIRRAKEGWKLVGSFTDKAVSGTDDKPELLKLRQLVEDGELDVDVIAVDALSRLSRRSLMDIGSDIRWIKDAGIKLSVASRNNGEPFTVDEFADDLSLMVDQYQNNQYVKKLSREVTNGMVTKFEKGSLGWIGKAPYGYDLKKSLDSPSTLVANDDLKIVKKIYKRFLAGDSIRSLIGLLEQTQQYQDGNYKRPNTTTVRNILRNSIYCGIRAFGVRGVGKHNTVAGVDRKFVDKSPLVLTDHLQEYKAVGFKTAVSVDDYNRVQKVLDSNSKAFKSFPERQRHKYSGLLRCSNCGTSLNSSTFKNKKTGETKISYTCPRSGDGTSVCKHEQGPSRKAIRTDELDKMIAKQFGIIIMSADFHKRNLEDVVERLVKRSKTSIAMVEEDLSIQQKRLEELIDLWTQTGSQTLKEQIDKQTKKLDALKTQAGETLEEDELLAFAKDQAEEAEDAGMLNRYFGQIYSLAVRIATLEHVEDRQKLIKETAFDIAEVYAKNAQTQVEQWNKKTGNNATDFGEMVEVGNFRVSAPDDVVMQTLKSMGLNHIKVTWELGLFRGKPRRVPTELSFVFSVTSKKYTDMYVLLARNQLLLGAGH